MNSAPTEAGTPGAEFKITHPRLIFGLRIGLASLTLVAVLLKLPLVAAILLLLLIVVLLLPTGTDEPVKSAEPQVYTTAASPEAVGVPLIEEVTRQLSTSLSIGQVAHTVLSASLRATNAELAFLALPPEVDHLMTIELRRGQENVQIVYRTYTGETLVEQAIQQGHQGRALINRDGSAIAVMLRHEYLVIGALCVEGTRGTQRQPEAASLSEIAVPAAISLHNARLLDDQQYQIDTLSHVQALSLRLAGAMDRNLVAQAILETTRDRLGAQEVALYRKGVGELELVLSLSRDRFSRSQTAKRLTRATAETCAANSDMQIIRQPVTCVAVPVFRDGTVQEILAAAFIERYTLRQRDLNTLSLLAGQAAAHLDTVGLHEQVRAVSERLRGTLNSARDGMLMIDLAGKLVECNPAAEQLLGVGKARYIGKPFVVMLFEMMKAGESSSMGYTRAMLPELTRQLRYEPNLITRRQFERNSGGQKQTIEEIGCPVIDGQAQITGRLLVLRDMSEQKRLAEFRDEMMHMAIHDLRGPLTAIMNGIDMTLKLGLTEFPEDNERVLRLSLGSAGDLMKLVNGLLDISRLESQRMPVNPRPLPVEELMESARLTLESSIREAQVELEVALPDALPLLNVDQDLIRRVLVNLIDNALRFTPAQTKILVTAEQSGEQQITLSIIDSGPGIPPNEREHIFEQYRQSRTNKALRGSNGSGLGLSFCKLAVEAHGGKIWAAASELLPGACISLHLPTIA